MSGDVGKGGLEPSGAGDRRWGRLRGALQPVAAASADRVLASAFWSEPSSERLMSTGYYKSFAEFQREMIHPGRRVGQSIEDILDPDVFQRDFDFDRDPFLDDEEEEDEDDY